MATLSVTLTAETSQWLQEQSGRLGTTPDALVSEIVEGRRAAEAFRALSTEVGRRAAERGLTPEVLGRLLDEPDE